MQKNEGEMELGEESKDSDKMGSAPKRRGMTEHFIARTITKLIKKSGDLEGEEEDEEEGENERIRHIDVLWMGEDGELLLTFAHMLKRSNALKRVSFISSTGAFTSVLCSVTSLTLFPSALLCPKHHPSQARIRVHSMASNESRAQRLKEGIRHTLHGMRVEADVHMAIIDAAWLGEMNANATRNALPRHAWPAFSHMKP